jgi:hypothetical protein
MRYFKKLSVLGVVLSFGISIVNAQSSLESSLKMMLENNAKGYIQPLVTGFGTAANSGLYKKASCETGMVPPVGFDIGIVANSAFFSGDESFTYDLMENTIAFPLSEVNQELPDLELTFSDLYDNGGVETTPTIVSDESGTELEPKTYNEIIDAMIVGLGDQGVDNPEQYRNAIKDKFTAENINNIVPSFQFPDGLNISLIPSAAIQANIRIGVIGLEVSGRYMPEVEITEEIGKISSYGIGLRKSLPVPIVDVSVGAFYQNLGIGDILTAENWNFHAEVGKELPLPVIGIYPYVGIGVDQTDISAEYTIPAGEVPGIDEDKSLKFDISGKNKFRGTVGVTLQLVPFTYLNIEGAFGNYAAATLSLGFIFK